MNPQKIVRLTAENFKRLSAVEIRPDGSLVVIGGRNAQGKSSVLDSITAALGGKTTHPTKPIRDGETRSEIVLELDDLIVTRTFTAKGSALVVANKDGSRHASPQSILDALTGAFDPLDFARQSPSAQAEILRRMTGLDFADVDAQRVTAYTDRTHINRDAKAAAAVLAELPPRHEGLPAEEETLDALFDEIREVQEHNNANVGIRAATLRAAEDLTRHSHAARISAQAIGRIEETLDKARADHEEIIKDIERAKAIEHEGRKACDALVEREEEPIRARIDKIGATNRQIRENAARAKEEARFEKLRAQSETLTTRIADLDAKKAREIAAAKMPIDGLSFDDEGHLTYNAIPFTQSSSAEQLRVSVAIGLALNPTIRVLLVRDGSLLDEENLAMLAQMAADAGAQVWIERVEDDAHVGILIEDGAVAEDRTANAPLPADSEVI